MESKLIKEESPTRKRSSFQFAHHRSLFWFDSIRRVLFNGKSAECGRKLRFIDPRSRTDSNSTWHELISQLYWRRFNNGPERETPLSPLTRDSIQSALRIDAPVVVICARPEWRNISFWMHDAALPKAIFRAGFLVSRSNGKGRRRRVGWPSEPPEESGSVLRVRNIDHRQALL